MLKFFSQYNRVETFFSAKADGNMKLGGKGFEKNRRRFLSQLGIQEGNLASAEIVHGNLAEIVENEGGVALGVDALVTSQKGIYLSVTVADCFPIFFYEKEKQIIALAHAGWRGILKDVISNTIDQIKKLGGNVENICVAIGPGIGECHFEIKNDSRKHFEIYEKFIEKRQGKMFVNLHAIILEKLEEQGVRRESIEISDICTFCEAQYFSYRRDKPEAPEAMIAIIGLV